MMSSAMSKPVQDVCSWTAKTSYDLAEGEGFEPSMELPPNRLSKAAP
jgi:hypothetical protein